MSRFFVDRKNITQDYIYITDREDVKHLSRVLRHKVGDVIEISDNCEFEYEIELDEISSEQAGGRILSKGKFEREPEVCITLYQGIPKQGKMELIIQKTVELGVGAVVPVFTGRTVVQDKGNFGKKIERWQKISDEAVKQCRRGIIPQIQDSMSLEQALKDMQKHDLNILFFEDERKTTLKEVLLSEREKNHKNIGVFIGPEGGFSQEEVDTITGAGARIASLGKTILRVETASVAAMAMIMYELEL